MMYVQLIGNDKSVGRLQILVVHYSPLDCNKERCKYWLRGQDLNLRPLGYEPNELPDCSTPRYKRICCFLYAHFIELCVWWSRRTVVLLACCHAPPRDIRKYTVFCMPILLSYAFGGLVVLSYSSHVAMLHPAI